MGGKRTGDVDGQWHERRWPDVVDGPWVIRLKLGLVAGRLQCIGIRVTAAEGSPPMVMSGTVLRDLPVAALVDEVVDDVGFKKLIRILKKSAEGDMSDDGTPRSPETEMLSFFLEVVQVYSDAAMARQPPTKAVARAFGLSRSAAGHAVARTRALGLLPATTRGRVVA